MRINASSPVNNNSFINKKNVNFGYSFFMKDVPVRCAYCGRNMLTISNINKLADSFANRTGASAIAVLRNNYRRLDNRQKVIVDILTDIISDNPDSNVISLIRSLAVRFEKSTNTEYADVIKKAYFLSGIKHHSQLGKRLALTIRNSQRNIFTKEKNSQQRILGITDLQNGLYNFIKEESNPEIIEKIKRFITTINTEFNFIKQDPRTFFAKFGFDTPRSFFGSLFSSIRSTADHIVTAGTNGVSDKSNYVAACGSCNWARGDKNFKTYVESSPRILNNMKIQFAFLDEMLTPPKKGQKFVKDSVKREIAEYLSVVIPTIEKELGYPLNLELPNTQRFLSKTCAKK